MRDGKYADALSNFGETKDFNKALATLLTGNATGVNAILDGGTDKEKAYSDYLRAVAAAKGGNNADAIANLKKAIEKDATLKAWAKDDVEFVKMRADAGFTSLVN